MFEQSLGLRLGCHRVFLGFSSLGHRDMPILTPNTLEQDARLRDLLPLLTGLPGWPQEFEFTSLQIDTARTVLHCECHHVGLLVAVTFGQYEGGKLMVNGKVYGTTLAPIILDGEAPHKLLPCTGERFAVMAFVHRMVEHLDVESVASLSEIGFNVPSLERIRQLAVTNVDFDSQDYFGFLSEEPLVPDGLGSARGMTPLEHVEWAKQLRHPGELDWQQRLALDQLAALEFEDERTPEQIDAFREERWTELENLAAKLESERTEWLGDRGLLHSKLASYLHGPVHDALFDLMEYSQFDAELKRDFAGFPLLGVLPSSRPHTETINACTGDKISVEELVKKRRLNNSSILNFTARVGMGLRYI